MVEACGLKPNKFLLSVALSLMIAIVNVIIVRQLGLPYATVSSVVLIESFALLGIVVFIYPKWRRLKDFTLDKTALVSALSLLFIVVAYTIFTGPYLEVPGDPWWHIAKLNDVLAAFEQGQVQWADWAQLLYAPNLYGYFVPALATYVSGYALQATLPWLNLANTILISMGIFVFAQYVFKEMKLGALQSHFCAVLTVLFFVMHFGVNVFSFVRYYAFAPTLLNQIVYLAAIGLVIHFFKTFTWRKELPAFILLSITAYLIHSQELLFIVIMSSLIVVVEYYYWRRSETLARSSTLANVSFYSVLVAWAALWFYSYTELGRSNPLAYNTIIPLEKALPFVKNLYVLDPTHQFYQVVGVWGLFVLLLFALLWIRSIKFPSYLVAGFLAPLLTVFNPFFVDLFLRHSFADVMWRVCYLIPLAFMGGYLLSTALIGASKSVTALFRIGNAAVALLLVGLLLPFSTTFFESKFSRLYTLKPTKPELSHQQWQDLFTFLNSRETKTVITDQVTGYLVNALTPHYYRGHKFYGFGAPKINQAEYSNTSFAEYSGSLVIVNRRDGIDSKTGRVSGHWPEKILKISRFYSPGFLTHVEQNPGLYRKIWDQRNIQVYEIRS